MSAEPYGVVFERLRDALGQAAAALGSRAPAADLELAEYFGIGGLLRRLAPAPTDPPRPPTERLVALTNRLLLEAADELAAALRRASVGHVFVKGVALLGERYQFGDRALVDVDLLIRPDARARAGEVFDRLGYRDLDRDEPLGTLDLYAGTNFGRGGLDDVDSVSLDVQWGMRPSDRFLPRADSPIPPGVWARAARGRLDIPSAEDHAALIVHHLVMHDLLHVRGLVDVVMLWPQIVEGGGAIFGLMIDRLGVGPAGRAVAQVLERDLGLPWPPGLRRPSPGLRHEVLTRQLRLDRWLTFAGAADSREQEMITRRRVLRRLLLTEGFARSVRLLGDALVPPREYLRWRWPDAPSDGAAWLRHLARVARKVGAP